MVKGKFKKPAEGEVYGFKLDDGRYGVAVLARVETARPRKPYAIFVYVFGPFANREEATSHLGRLDPGLRKVRVLSSALGIYLGDWTYVGVVPNWRREEWTFPEFYSNAVRIAPIVKVTLSETDLGTQLKHQPVVEIGELEEHILYGSESVRAEASKLMQYLPTIKTMQR